MTLGNMLGGFQMDFGLTSLSGLSLSACCPSKAGSGNLICPSGSVGCNQSVCSSVSCTNETCEDHACLHQACSDSSCQSKACDWFSDSGCGAGSYACGTADGDVCASKANG